MGLTPKNLWYPDNTTQAAPLPATLATMQASVDTALAALPVQNYGSYSVITGAGFDTVSHGLGRVPIAVVATPSIGPLEGILVVITGSFTSTTFVAKFYRHDSGGALGGDIRFSWIAV